MPNKDCANPKKNYEYEELIKLNVRDITYPVDFVASVNIFEQSIEERTSFQIEKRYICNDGNLIWVQNTVSPMFDATGQMLFVQTFTIDVTDRKRAEEAVKKSEKQLQTVLESTEDHAIIIYDLKGRITRFNSGTETTFGYSEQEITGQDGAILFTPEERSKKIPKKEMNTALEKGRAENERWYLRKNGTRFYASGVLQLLRNGEVEGFVRIAHDETQRIATKNEYCSG